MKIIKGISIVVLMAFAALGVAQLLPGITSSGTTPDVPESMKPASVPPGLDKDKGTDNGKVRPVRPGFAGNEDKPGVAEDDAFPPDGKGEDTSKPAKPGEAVAVPEIPEMPDPSDKDVDPTGTTDNTNPRTTGTGTTTRDTGATTGTTSTTNPAGTTGTGANNTTINKPNTEKEEMLEFDFKNTDIQIVVRSFAAQIKKNFILPKTLAGNVTIITGKPIPKSKAFEVLETILMSQGFAMYEDEYFIRIEKTGTQDDKANPTKDILYIKGQKYELEKRDNTITAIIVLQYVNAQEITPVLTSVKSPQALLITFQKINALFFRGTQRELAYLGEIIAMLDQPGTARTKITIVKLKNSAADEVAAIVNDVALARSFDPTAAIAPPTPGGGRSARSSVTAGLTIIPIERTNSIIIIASEKETEEILDLIAELDAPILEPVTSIHTFACNNQEATELAELLENFVSRRVETKEEAGAVPPIPTAGSEKEVFFIADEKTNTIIVQAPPQEWPRYLELLRFLDQPQRQVLIEAWIVEVSSTNDKTFGVEITPSDQPPNEKIGPMENTIYGTSRTSDTSLSGVFGGTTTDSEGNAVSSATAGTGLTLGVRALTGTQISIDGRQVTIPNFDVFMRAVKTTSDVRILASPKLVTINNEPATVNITDEISIATSEISNIDSTGGVSTKNYERSEIGILLDIEPRINADDSVIMTLSLEVSNLVGDLSLNPTIARRLTKNKVRCENKQTIVISGLRRNNETTSLTGIPLLMDIPLLGRLFSSSTKNQVNTNLLIFITPHIVTETSDMIEMREYLQNQRLQDETKRFQITGKVKEPSKKKEPNVYWVR